MAQSVLSHEVCAAIATGPYDIISDALLFAEVELTMAYNLDHFLIC